MPTKHVISDIALDVLTSLKTDEVIIEKLREIKNTPPVPADEEAFRAHIKAKLAEEFNADPSLEQKIMDSTKVSEQQDTHTAANQSNGDQNQQSNENVPPPPANGDGTETPPPVISKQWTHSLTILTIGVAILVIFSILWCKCNSTSSVCFNSTALVPIVIIVIILLIIAFLYLFTGDIPEWKMRGMFVFCYFFTFSAIVLSLVPFFLYTHEKPTELYNHMLDSSIGVIKGCSEPIKEKPEKEKAWVPHEIRCDNNTDQWIVNIGGTVEKQTTNIGKVRGGLVVPLYFIVLALIGGAISMTRRIPEFQRQVITTVVKDKITKARAREMLVFQIMQFVSAPIIAVTAYYLLDPGSRKFTVALGFTAGFASETILIMIRAIVDKLKPTIESVDGNEEGIDDMIEEKKKAVAVIDKEIEQLNKELKKLKDDKAAQAEIDAKDKEIKDKESAKAAIEAEISTLTTKLDST